LLAAEKSYNERIMIDDDDLAGAGSINSDTPHACHTEPVRGSGTQLAGRAFALPTIGLVEQTTFCPVSSRVSGAVFSIHAFSASPFDREIYKRRTYCRFGTSAV